MNKIVNNELKCNASAFIIPNTASLVRNFLCEPEERERKYVDLCEINNTHYDPEKDRIVQLWYVSKDIGTENLIDHAARAIDEEGNSVIIHVQSEYGFLPESMLRGHNEGDVVQVKLPAEVYDRESEEDRKITLVMDLKLQQKGYRYARFGEFQEVLEKVCR